MATSARQGRIKYSSTRIKNLHLPLLRSYTLEPSCRECTPIDSHTLISFFPKLQNRWEWYLTTILNTILVASNIVHDKITQPLLNVDKNLCGLATVLQINPFFLSNYFSHCVQIPRGKTWTNVTWREHPLKNIKSGWDKWS